MRIAAEVGIEDYRQTLQFHKDKGDAFFVAPMGSYVYYHIKLMEMIEQGDLTPDRIAKLTKEVSKISAVTKPDALSK